jgi:membrane protease YdiL (CAAX protease family)
MEKTAPRSPYFTFFIILFLVLWTLRATVFYSIDLGIESPVNRKIYSESIKVLVWTIPVFLFLIIVDKTNPFRALKLSTRPKCVGWIVPVAGLIGFFVVTLLFEYFAHGRSLDFSSGATGLLGSLASVSITPISEEILFRGLILGKLSETTSFARANVITSILFIAIHQPNWLWVNGFKPWMPLVSGGIFILSLLLGWLVQKTNSLYPAIAGHIINNFIAVLLKP